MAALPAHRSLVGDVRLVEGECVLCAVLSDPLHRRFPEEAYETVRELMVGVEGDYRRGRAERQRRVSQRLAARPELGLTVPDVERHHRFHRVPMTVGVGRAVPAKVRRLERELRPRELAVLSLAARLGVISLTQAAVVMGAVAEQPSGKRGRPYERVGRPADRRVASKLLRRLVADELLVAVPLRFAPGPRTPGRPPMARKAWGLTQRSIALLQVAGEPELHDLRLRPLLREVNVPEERSDETAAQQSKRRRLARKRERLALDPVGIRGRHDLGVGDALCALLLHAMQAPKLALPTSGPIHELELSFRPGNWWAAQHLLMSFTPPAVIRDGRQRPSRGEAVTPDAFAVVGVRGGALNVALPFFVEYDSGYRTLWEAVDQLVGHTALALSGAPLSRFPDLAVAPLRTPDGRLRPFRVPLLFITHGLGGSRGTGRLNNLARAYADRMSEQRYFVPGEVDELPPAYLCLGADLHEQGWMMQVVSLHAPERGPQPFLRVLVADSASLRGQLSADVVLRLDRKGAAFDRQLPAVLVRSRSEREQDRHEELKLRARLDALHERQRAWELQAAAVADREEQP